MNVGERIRLYRKQKKMTQKQLAEEIHISLMSIQRYERNERQPHIETLKKIADIFDVPIIELIGDDPNSNLNFNLIKYEVDKEDDFIKVVENLDDIYKKPSDIKKEKQIKKEMNGIIKAVEDMLSNEYIEKEYGYKYNELSIDDQSELYGFMHKLLKIKVDEIKLRNK